MEPGQRRAPCVVPPMGTEALLLACLADADFPCLVAHVEHVIQAMLLRTRGAEEGAAQNE